MFHKNRQHGAGLIEAIIGIGLFAFVVTGTTKFFGQNVASTKKFQYRDARDKLAYVISEAISNPENIALSASNGLFNNPLRNCIRNNNSIATGPCRAIGINNAQTFSLSVEGDGPNGQVIVGRPNLNDVHYDWSSIKPNSSGSGDNVFHPTAYFWGDCGIDPRTKRINTSCNKAANIYVSFVIRPSSGPYSANYLGAPKLPDIAYPYPRELVSLNGDIKKNQLYRNAAVISAFAVSNRMESRCQGEDKFIAGYDSQGKPICECFMKDCRAKKCRNDQILVGWTDIRGSKYKNPKCRTLTNSNDFTCRRIGGSSCSSGEWLSRYTPAHSNVGGDAKNRFCYGSAKFSPKNKGGWQTSQSWRINCSKRSKWQCCRIKK